MQTLDDVDFDEMFEEMLRLKARLERMVTIARQRGEEIAFTEAHMPAWYAIRDERNDLLDAWAKTLGHEFKVTKRGNGTCTCGVQVVFIRDKHRHLRDVIAEATS